MTEDRSIPFKYHGLLLDDYDDHAIGDCPFCDGGRHFYVNRNKGLWDCKVCGEQGNIYTFLGRLHSLGIEKTTRGHYSELYHEKGLPQDVFRSNGLCVSPFNAGIWLLPAYSTKSTVVNLYTWRSAEGADDDNEIHSTKGIGHSLLNLHRFSHDPSAVVYLAEGHWDTYVVQAMLDHVGSNDCVLGVPGCNIFDRSWLKFIHRRHVYILYDNDDPGLAGTNRLLKMFKESLQAPSSVSVLSWPDDMPRTKKGGTDIRDVFLSLRLLEK